VRNMLDGFKTFIMRGNVIDLAVAVVIGAAFATVVSALTEGILFPLIAAIFGEPDLTNVWTFEINEADFSIGLFLDAVLNFLLVAAALYFCIVFPMNKLAERRARGKEPEPAPVPEPNVVLLAEIRDLLAEQNRRA
jgi:large conductance mechanosensitive channel